MARDEGYQDGFNDGFNDGFSDGFSDGNDKMQERINQLNVLLSESGRTADIIQSARDKSYQEALFKEFNL